MSVRATGMAGWAGFTGYGLWLAHYLPPLEQLQAMAGILVVYLVVWWLASTE